MDLVKDRFVSVEEESVGDLLRDFRDEAINMARQQIELAKTETSEKVSKFSRNAAYLAAGGAVAYAGGLFLLAGLTYLGYIGLLALGLSAAVSIWLMPLITGVVVATVGTILVFKAINTFKNTSAVPKKTVQSIKEDRQWISEKRK
ncbi:MAG: phage holin family protein [Chitinispirillaceae bacterium]